MSYTKSKPLLFLFISLQLHVFTMVTLSLLTAPTEKTSSYKVKLQIITEEPMQPKTEVVPPKPKKPQKPKVRKNKQVASLRQPTMKQTPPPAVQGLSKDSLVENAQVVAPVGNTLFMEDQGQRLDPNEVKDLESDLSSDAKLILNSVKIPDYTQLALDANLEGAFKVDVYVDAQGIVTEIELRKKIGYGMDDRVLESIKNAKFLPRKNALGNPVAGWAEITYTLTIP